MFCYRKKNNRVATEVLLQRMGQQEAERRSCQERVSESRNAWAPVLAESVSDLHDVRVECGEDDPQPVWRATAMVRLACTAAKQVARRGTSSRNGPASLRSTTSVCQPEDVEGPLS
jgi:hypothetical protein